jgi:hypothetical protein
MSTSHQQLLTLVAGGAKITAHRGVPAPTPSPAPARTLDAGVITRHAKANHSLLTPTLENLHKAALNKSPSRLHYILQQIDEKKLQAYFKATYQKQRLATLVTAMYFDEAEPAKAKLLLDIIKILVGYGMIRDNKFETEHVTKKRNSLKEKDKQDTLSKRWCDLNNNARDDSYSKALTMFPLFHNIAGLERYYKGALKEDRKLDALYKDTHDFLHTFDEKLPEQEFHHRLNRYLQNIRTRLNSSSFDSSSNLHGLSECYCNGSHEFDRCRNYRRQNLEELIVKDAKQQFNADDAFLLNYLSIGSGGLLQDFILIIKLILQGYKKINIVFLEPRLSNSALQIFSQLARFAAQNNVMLVLRNFQNIREFTRDYPAERFHLIHAIDLGSDAYTAFNDLMIAHSLLADDGKFYLAFHQYDFCFTKTECVLNKYHQREDKELTSSIMFHAAMLNEQKSVHYASLGQSTFFEWTQMISRLHGFQGQHIKLTITQPLKKDFWGTPEAGEVNDAFTQSNLQYFFQLFLPGKNIEVCVINENGIGRFLSNILEKKDSCDFMEATTTTKENFELIKQFCDHAQSSNTWHCCGKLSEPHLRKIEPIQFATQIPDTSVIRIMASYLGLFHLSPAHTQLGSIPVNDVAGIDSERQISLGNSA